MNITEVRVKLLEGRSDRLRAFCSITIGDEFVVHDLRVIDGRKGLFVAMPSRKLSDNCSRCGGKNHLRAKFCSECGAKLDENRSAVGVQTRDKFHVDVAHPINTACRELIQTTVLKAYKEEISRAEQGLGPTHAYEPEAPGEPGEEYYEEGIREAALGPEGVMEDPEPYEAPRPTEQEDGDGEPAGEEPSGEEPEQQGEQAEAADQEDEQEKPGGFGEGIF